MSGSDSHTSSATESSLPERNMSKRASVSITSPRPALISRAPAPNLLIAALSIIWCVGNKPSYVNGVCTQTMSLPSTSLRLSTGNRPSAGKKGSYTRQFTPIADRVLQSCPPTLPQPIIPTVLSCQSGISRLITDKSY